jgi:hypothetical protein
MHGTTMIFLFVIPILAGFANYIVPLQIGALDMAFGMLTAGNDRASARLLWTQILDSDQEWLRRTAVRSLQQLDALDLIDQLQAIVRRFPPAAGTPYSWDDYVKRGILRIVPFDASKTPLDLDPSTGQISISKASPLWPMPSLGS